MSNKFFKKVVDSIKKNIEMYSEEIKKTEENLAAIDEKYRKLAEEAKKELTEDLKVLKIELSVWNDTLKRYENSEPGADKALENSMQIVEPENATEPAMPECPTETVENNDGDGRIVDTVFPENNEQVEEPQEQEEENAATDTGEPSQIEKDLNGIWPEEQESEEKPEQEQAQEEQLPEENWNPDGDESVNENEQVEGEAEAEWPDFPEEWKD